MLATIFWKIQVFFKNNPKKALLGMSGALFVLVAFFSFFSWLAIPRFRFVSEANQTEAPVELQITISSNVLLPSDFLSSLSLSPEASLQASFSGKKIFGAYKQATVALAGLKTDTSYILTVRSPKKRFGRTGQDVHYEFSTLSSPVVQGSVPYDQDTTVSPTQEVALYFTKKVAAESFAVEISPAIAFTKIQSTDTVVKLVPSSPWQENTKYSVHVLPKDEGKETQRLKTPFSFSFTTSEKEFSQLTNDSDKAAWQQAADQDYNDALKNYIDSSPKRSVVQKLPYQTDSFSLMFLPDTDEFVAFLQPPTTESERKVVDWLAENDVSFNDINISFVGPPDNSGQF